MQLNTLIKVNKIEIDFTHTCQLGKELCTQPHIHRRMYTDTMARVAGRSKLDHSVNSDWLGKEGGSLLCTEQYSMIEPISYRQCVWSYICLDALPLKYSSGLQRQYISCISQACRCSAQHNLKLGSFDGTAHSN